MMKLFLAATCLLSASLAPAELVRLEAPAGPGSLAPGLSALDEGRAVLTWLERLDEGHALKFSMFDGAAFGPAHTIATGTDWFANWADMPGLFVLPDGRWLAHWLVKSGPATYAYDVVMAMSIDHGQTWSTPFSPHDDGTPTEHGFVSYFAWDQQQAGVVWLDGRETAAAAGQDHGADGYHHHHHHGDGAAMTLRVAGVNGVGQIEREAVLDPQVCDCCQTAAGMTSSGPVVVYRGRSDDEIRDILIVRKVDGGWTEPVPVHVDGWQIAGCPVNGPVLIADDQNLVVAWFTMADGEPRVQVVRSDDAGRTFTNPVTLGHGTAMGRVDLAWVENGFVLVWIDHRNNRGLLELTRFDRQGGINQQYTLADIDSGRVSGFPQVLSLPGHRLLLAWTESLNGGPGRVVSAVLSLDSGQSPAESH